MNQQKNFMALQKQQYESTREYAIRCLEYNIVNFMLKPGQLVSEQRISKLLSISRTPVREAFFDLSKIGILEIFPQKGTMVSLIDAQLVEESRFMRWAIERAIISIVCEKQSIADVQKMKENLTFEHIAVEKKDVMRQLELDNSLHNLFFTIADKTLCGSIIQKLHVHFDRARMLNLLNMDARRTLHEHEMLVEMIEVKNTAKAVNLIDTHLTHVIEDMKVLQTQYPQYFKI